MSAFSSFGWFLGFSGHILVSRDFLRCPWHGVFLGFPRVFLGVAFVVFFVQDTFQESRPGGPL